MKGLYDLIPDEYADVIKSRLFADKLCDIRIRNGMPVRLGYAGANYYLCKSGLTKEKGEAFIAHHGEAERVILRACEHSLYTVTDTIKLGYIAVGGGVRVGVCGTAVMTGGELSAVKDFSSVNIRVPHEIKGCAGELYLRVKIGGQIKSTLIISPPGGGKTTVLRDLIRLMSNGGANVAVCDEKHELASAVGGMPALDVGVNTDVISGTDRRRAFSAAIANLAPDVICADEIMNDTDSIYSALNCGIAVVATAHARDRGELMRRKDMAELIGSGAFSVIAAIRGADRRVTAEEVK